MAAEGLAGVLVGVGAFMVWKGNRSATRQTAGKTATPSRAATTRLDYMKPPAIWSFPVSDAKARTRLDPFVDGVIRRLSVIPDTGEALGDQKVRLLNDAEFTAAVRNFPDLHGTSLSSPSR
jgi:hypothetical protein